MFKYKKLTNHKQTCTVCKKLIVKDDEIYGEIAGASGMYKSYHYYHKECFMNNVYKLINSNAK